jgi:hypothetical protein
VAKTPTQRSLDLMRERGYKVEITERWNAFAKRRVDLFGFIDLLCIRPGEVVGIQTTSYSNVSARVNKIAEHENVAHVREAGIRIIVHGWKKGKKRGTWECREVDCS